MPWSCSRMQRRAVFSVGSGGARMLLKSRPRALQCSMAGSTSSMSTRPTISSTVRKPSCAMYSRISCARNLAKRSTCSGLPAKRARSLGSCVAMPTGQVFMWHLRTMTQPIVTSTELPKPNSSAPSSAAMARSRPVLSWPSVCTRMRSRRRLRHQGLLRLGQAEFPRQAGVLDGGERAGAGAAVVAADEHHVGPALGHAGRDGADADLADELDRDARVDVGVLQVVDELRQVLDGVDVVVRRRGDQRDAGRGVAHVGDLRR